MGSGDVVYSGEVTTPDLVVISPGVQVIADFDQPIFYSDSYYWRNEGGAWYRSPYYTRGWVRYDAAPVAILSIQRPSAYVHYHGEGHAGMARDHREPMPRPQAREPMPPRQARDHRGVVRAPEPRRDESRDERKDERKDERHDKDHRH